MVIKINIVYCHFSNILGFKFFLRYKILFTKFSDSMKWKCSLMPEDLKDYISVEEETEDDEKEYAKLGKCFHLTDIKVLKQPKTHHKDSSHEVNYDIKENETPNFNIDSPSLFENDVSNGIYCSCVY